MNLKLIYLKLITGVCFFAIALCAMAADDFTAANPQGQYRYLITFTEPGLLQQADRAPGERFDVDTAARETLMARQAGYRRAMDAALGRTAEVSHQYLATHSGMAAWLTPAEAEAVARLDGVVSVERERRHELATYRGPWFIGAESVWNGDSVPNGTELRGEGMVLGILDTGIDADHPAFADDPACGHGQGEVPAKLLGALDCAGTDAQGVCNGANPQDHIFHGTHVAGTAGGNRLDEATEPPPAPPGAFTEISGVAPCAHIRSYKVCPDDYCYDANILAGLNSVLVHGDVDVVNFSISGGTIPWQDNDRRKLDLVDAGVLVAAAAGNTGTVTDPVGEVNHHAPWVLTVAASTHDGGGEMVGRLSVTGPDEPPDDIQDIPMTQGSESPVGTELADYPLRRFAGQPDGFEGCNPGEDGAPPDMTPFPEGFFEGAVALIQRGNCPFSKKITNAFNAGAAMVIVRNNESDWVVMDTAGQPNIPAYSVPQSPGEVLAAFVAQHPDAASVDFALVPDPGDVLANFSLRGPTPPPLQNLTKPDITAPGVEIYAPVPLYISLAGYGFSDGTSMSSPHAAGAALLVRQAQPEWTVSEVKSALMMTASARGTKEDGATDWDWDEVGSGRVDLTRAALAGLVMNETTDNYLAADPIQGGDVRTLNLPALRDMDCNIRCSWTRTLRNTLGQPANWTVSSPESDDFVVQVSPSEFSFSGDTREIQELTIAVIPTGDQSAAVAFGEIRLNENSGLVPEQRVTVAVRGIGPSGPLVEVAPDHIRTTLEAGDTGEKNLALENLGIEPLNWSIAAGEVAGAFPAGRHPALDEPLALPGFELTSPANGGEPAVLTVSGGVASRGLVTGFSFAGTVSGLAGTSWASDTCMIVEAPDGSRYAVGGNSGAAGCGENDWDFQGPGSGGNGEYGSVHHDVFDPPVSDRGHWTFTFANDWNHPSADTIAWTDAVVTLHKTAVPACDDPADVAWLSVTPSDGVILPEESDNVTLTFDGGDLSPGTYGAALCIASDDPDAGLMVVPVVLVVDEDSQPPGDEIFSDDFVAEGP